MIIVLINVLVPDLNTAPRTHLLLHPERHNLIMFYHILFLYAWISAIIAGYAEAVH